MRCSRCKHAFFVTPAGGGGAEAIEEVVAEVTGSGGTSAPEPAQDLLDKDHRGSEPEPLARSTQLRAEDRGSGEFEEDWEFNDDAPPEIPSRAEFEAPRLGGFDMAALDPGSELSEPEIAVGDPDPIGEPEPEVPPAAKPPRVDPVEAIRAREAELDAPAADELGSPADWDFVGKAEVEPPAQSAAESAVPFADEEGSTSPSPVLEELPSSPRPAQVEADQLPWVTRLAGLASIGGWILVILGFSLGMSSVVTQPSARVAARGQAAEMAVPGLDLTATEVRGRLLENALVGDLLVVSGNLENRGSNAVTPLRTVWVQLVSANGKPIAGARAAAGRALSERRLREQDPDQLRRDLERSAVERAYQPLLPGEGVRFDAVFDSVPETATGWVLEAVSSPSSPDPGSSLLSTTPPVWE